MRLMLISLLLSSCHPTDAARGDGRSLIAKAHALDGDTVAVDYRLFGADAFEKRQLCRRTDGCWPCGKTAQDLASAMLKRSEVVIRTVGSTSDGRPVATVKVDGQDLGELMIAQGLAVPRPGFLRADPTRAARYQAAYLAAGKARRGAHAGYFIDPTDWRHGKRLSCEEPDSRSR